MRENWDRLFQNMQGDPVDPSNGGFLREVSPLFGDPGRVEVQHYLTGGDTINWRVFIGTDHAIDGARLTIALPDVGGDYRVTDATPWGLNYAKSTGAPYTIAHTPQQLGATEVLIGDMPAGSTTTVTFSARIDGSRHAVTDTFMAKAFITGSYQQGDGCAAAPEPTPTP
ncbi:MAG: hypothetical protein Q4G43_14605, partial [Mobilicoccus sp.]|nr:hypothetical protein [Mobilicoccus sp.]